MKNRLKEVMQQQGMTGRQLASLMGTTPQYISNLVSGRQSLSMNTISEIAGHLGVEPWQLFVSKKEVIGEDDFIAMIRYKGEFHHALSVAELEELIAGWKSGNNE